MSACEYRVIPISGGREVKVDADLFEELSAHRWFGVKKGNHFYAARQIKVDGKWRGKIWMHRVIAATPEGFVTDHINGDTLDNRSANLRFCSIAENVRNSKSTKNKFGYKGVSVSMSGRWKSEITVDRRRIHIGVFDSAEDAAAAYNSAATTHFGAFARLNELKGASHV